MKTPKAGEGKTPTDVKEGGIAEDLDAEERPTTQFPNGNRPETTAQRPQPEGERGGP